MNSSNNIAYYCPEQFLVTYSANTEHNPCSPPLAMALFSVNESTFNVNVADYHGLSDASMGILITLNFLIIFLGVAGE